MISKWLRVCLFLLAIALVSVTQVQAQAQRRPTSPNDTLKSAEVSDNHKITFRIYAPKATEVTVNGEFGPGGKLTKDDQGVWSLTVGPVAPDFYSYTFIVDGVRTVDPKSAFIKPGLNSLSSVVDVPGDEAKFEANHEVPHGEIRTVWYRSATLNSQRSMHVYTPPGYETGDTKYPVLYLLHGSGDEDSGWSTTGRAGFILDNLIAHKKAKPMLVVMPNGSLPRPTNMPRVAPGTPPTPEAEAARRAFQNRFTDELIKEVVPTIESRYRVQNEASSRALAGLSMGGGQTLQVATTHFDKFAYFGIWSAGIFGNVDDFTKRNTEFLANADKINASVKLLAITIGDKDFLLASSKSLIELLSKHGIKHEYTLTEGGHTWTNWRHYLNEFAPKLFQ